MTKTAKIKRLSNKCSEVLNLFLLRFNGTVISPAKHCCRGTCREDQIIIWGMWCQSMWGMLPHCRGPRHFHLTCLNRYTNIWSSLRLNHAVNNLLFPVRKKKNTPFIISSTFNPIPICCVERRSRCFRVKFGLCLNSAPQCKQYSPSVFGGRLFSSQWEQLSRVNGENMGGTKKGKLAARHRHPIQAVRRPLLAPGTSAEGRRVKNTGASLLTPKLPQAPVYCFKTQGRFFFFFSSVSHYHLIFSFY